MVDAGLIPPPQPALSTLPLKTENPRDSTISLNSRSGKNAAVDEEEEAIRTRLEAIGLHVGTNFAERLCRDRSLFTETLDVIKFVCKDLWAACWDRQVDNLRTNHRGIYVLQDNVYHLGKDRPMLHAKPNFANTYTQEHSDSGRTFGSEIRKTEYFEHIKIETIYKVKSNTMSLLGSEQSQIEIKTLMEFSYIPTTWNDTSHLTRRLVFLLITLGLTCGPTFYIATAVVNGSDGQLALILGIVQFFISVSATLLFAIMPSGHLHRLLPNSEARSSSHPSSPSPLHPNPNEDIITLLSLVPIPTESHPFPSSEDAPSHSPKSAFDDDEDDEAYEGRISDSEESDSGLFGLTADFIHQYQHEELDDNATGDDHYAECRQRVSLFDFDGFPPFPVKPGSVNSTFKATAQPNSPSFLPPIHRHPIISSPLSRPQLPSIHPTPSEELITPEPEVNDRNFSFKGFMQRIQSRCNINKRKKPSSTGATSHPVKSWEWTSKSTSSSSQPKPTSNSTPSSSQPKLTSKSSSSRSQPKPNSKSTSSSSLETPKPKRTRRKDPIHILRDEVLAEARGTIRAFQTHICMVLGLVDGKTAPEQPPPHIKKNFAEWFHNPTSFSTLVKNLDRRDPDSNSIGKDIALVKEIGVRTFFAMYDSYGFEQWCPDWSEPCTSFYNNCHQTFAIDSFQQACMVGGYNRFGVDSKLYTNQVFLIKTYDNYVFGTLRDKARKEARDPGALERRVETNGIGKRRRAKAKEREIYLLAHRYSERVIKAVRGTYCASKDEGPIIDEVTGKRKLINNHPYYIVKDVLGHHPLLTAFVRKVDEDIARQGTAGSMVEPTPGARRKGSRIVGTPESRRQRIVPENPLPPHSHFLPADVPLDFFNPDFFNNLSVLDRAKYGYKPEVAFPPNVDVDWLMANPEKWGTREIDSKQFKALYGSKEFAYNIPTPDEVAEWISGEKDEEAEEREQYREDLEALFMARVDKRGQKRTRSARNDGEESGEDFGEDLYADKFRHEFEVDQEDDEDEDKEYRPSQFRAGSSRESKRRRHREGRNHMQEDEDFEMHGGDGHRGEQEYDGDDDDEEEWGRINGSFNPETAEYVDGDGPQMPHDQDIDDFLSDHSYETDTEDKSDESENEDESEDEDESEEEGEEWHGIHAQDIDEEMDDLTDKHSEDKDNDADMQSEDQNSEDDGDDKDEEVDPSDIAGYQARRAHLKVLFGGEDEFDEDAEGDLDEDAEGDLDEDAEGDLDDGNGMEDFHQGFSAYNGGSANPSEPFVSEWYDQTFRNQADTNPSGLNPPRSQWFHDTFGNLGDPSTNYHAHPGYPTNGPAYYSSTQHPSYPTNEHFSGEHPLYPTNGQASFSDAAENFQQFTAYPPYQDNNYWGNGK
ncbi:hypothetical protein D9758_014615 [Tetrapyrgos nigripes]|uniref:1,3-beta-glucan synthase component FKS1-like domain-containing protein n=1 Tax=Tetrapyrgos nigripes TaxID=182062 RepID=A0A8H5CWT0_9AGAR|nr:hypothetical protein D9758_014615 [Tetrapyrgos nigripes]